MTMRRLSTLFLILAALCGAHQSADAAKLNVGTGRALLASKAGNVAPSWVPSQFDQMYIDFNGNRAWTAAGGTVPISSLVSLTRTSSETYIDAAGNMTYPASGVLANGNAGLQIYDAATNNVLQSSSYGTAPWAVATASVSANQTNAPDGTNTAFALIEDSTATTIHQISQASIPITANVNFTCYALLKSRPTGGTRWITLGMTSATNVYLAVTADLVGGSITQEGHVGGSFVGVPSITPLVNGWYMVSFSGSLTSGTTAIALLALSNTATFTADTRGRNIGYTGNGTSGIFMAGNQCTAGLTVAPYIPTTTAAVTTAADNITLTGQAATLLSAATMTAVVGTNNSQASAVATLIDENGTVLLGKTANNTITTAATSSLSSTAILNATAVNSLGISVAPGASVLGLNYFSNVTDAVTRQASGTIHLGSTSGSSAFWNGNVTGLGVSSKSLAAFPKNSFFEAFAADEGWIPAIIGSSQLYVLSTNTTWFALETWQLNAGTPQYVEQVLTYNHTSGVWAGPFVAGLQNALPAGDPHGIPALVQDTDGYVHMFYGAHVSALKQASTTNPNDATTWHAVTISANIPTTFTFPHPIIVGSNIYLFSTTGSGAQQEDQFALNIATFSGGVLTFGTTKVLVDFTGASQWALPGTVVAHGTDIHFSLYALPAGDGTNQKNIYYFIYDTTTGNIRDASNTVSIVPASQPITQGTAVTSFQAVDSTTGNLRNSIGVSAVDGSTVHLVYTQGDSNSLNIKLYHKQNSGSGWSTPDLLYTYPANVFVYRSEAYTVAVRSAGVIDVYYSDGVDALGFPNPASGDGSLWKITQTSGVFGSASLILAPTTYGLGVPSAIVNPNANARLVFGEAFSHPSSTIPPVPIGSLRGYVYGDGGFLGR